MIILSGYIHIMRYYLKEREREIFCVYKYSKLALIFKLAALYFKMQVSYYKLEQQQKLCFIFFVLV